MTKLKPLDLSNLLRDAFLTGAGLKQMDRIPDAIQKAWCDYDPEPIPAYQRVVSALSAALAVETGAVGRLTYDEVEAIILKTEPADMSDRGDKIWTRRMAVALANLFNARLTPSPASSAVEGEAAYWVAETRMGLVPAAPYQPHAIPLYRHPAPTPVVIHFEEAGHYQLMTADVPTFTGQPMTVQPLRDMQTREIMGFQWDDAPTPAGEWRTMDSAPKDGSRILLMWMPFSGMSEHVELGKWSVRNGWVNTYGHAFSGEPDRWMALPPALPASPAPHQEGRADG